MKEWIREIRPTASGNFPGFKWEWKSQQIPPLLKGFVVVKSNTIFEEFNMLLVLLVDEKSCIIIASEAEANINLEKKKIIFRDNELKKMLSNSNMFDEYTN